MKSVFLVFCVLFVVVTAQLSSVLSNANTDSLSSKAAHELSHITTLRNAYLASKYLARTQPKLKLKCDCKQLTSAVDHGSDALDLFYAFDTLKTCGCAAHPLAASSKDKLESGVLDGDIQSFVGSVLALKSMGVEDSVTISAIVDKLKPLLQTSGLVKSTPEDDRGTLHNAKLALMLLDAFFEHKQDFGDMVDSFLHLLPSGDDDSVSDPTLLASIVNIADKKPRISASRLVVISEALLALASGDDAISAIQAVESLDSVLTYKIAPIYLNLEKNSFQDSDSHKKLTISLLDVAGKILEHESIQVKSIKQGTREIASGEGLEVKKLSVDLSKLDLAPGKYTIEFAVQVPGRSNAVSFIKSFAVTTTVEVKNVLAGVTDSKQSSSSDLQSISSQNKLGDLTLEHDYFHVAFALKSKSGVKPHQSFIKFTHKDSGVSTYFVAKALKQSESESQVNYRAVISPADEVETFLYKSGEYIVSVIIGDVTLNAPVEWVLGSVHLKFPNKPIVDYPIYKRALLFESDNALSALPDFDHQMRLPDKRASLSMSYTFSCLIVGALLIFLGYLISLKPNLKRFKSLSSLLFLLSFGGVFALYLGYWLSLPGFTFYEAIYKLCFLMPFTFLFGRSALNSVQEAREAEEKKKKQT